MQTNDEVEVRDEVAVQINGQAHHTAASLNRTVPPGSNLVEFILGQLAPAEQIGFLRGEIILLSARLGTPAQVDGDTDALDYYNYLFQSKLRTLMQENAQQHEAAAARDAAVKLAVDEDARSRGFESSAQMQVELAELYKSVDGRIREWHTATEPGGDVTSAPDEQRLLYDVYRICAGVGLSK